MNIYYNNDGVPFILNDENVIIDFNQNNQSFLVGELATDPDAIKELFNTTKKHIDKRVSEYQSAQKNNFEECKNALRIITKIMPLVYVVDLCNDAENLHCQLTTPKKHQSWVWNSELRSWVAPIPIPYGEPGEIYDWDDVLNNWTVVLPKPYPDWLWSSNQHKWIAPVEYPIDAGPGEFMWDSSKETWILDTES